MHEQPTPTLSVGLPVYNGERFLAELLDSVLAQTYSDFELVISNNASNDCTDEICSRYAALDNRIRYFKQADNIGLFPNFEFVYNKSRGQYFCVMGHDDRYEPDYFEKLMAEHVMNPGLDLVYSDYAYISELGEIDEKSLVFFMDKSDSPYQNFKRYMRKKITLPAMMGIFRKSSYKYGLPFVDFGNDMTGGIDLVFFYRFLALARVSSIREKLFYYRVKDRSAVSPSTWRANRFTAWLSIFKLNLHILFAHLFPIIASARFSLWQKFNLWSFAFLIFCYEFIAQPLKRLVVRR